jgi:ferritin
MLNFIYAKTIEKNIKKLQEFTSNKSDFNTFGFLNNDETVINEMSSTIKKIAGAFRKVDTVSHPQACKDFDKAIENIL